MDLHAARTVYYVDEGSLPVAATARNPSCDAVAVLGFLPSRQFRIPGADLGYRDHARERMRERVDTLRAQAFQLGAAVVLRVRG
jgi:hypothetical protein